MNASEESPHGVKRRMEDATSSNSMSKRIKALDQAVVSKIAAGEIIVAPMHALKELIENAVDAGSTNLEVAVKDGGMKLLQITDNGHGIHRDDLPILCERFTTSKLKNFEDLESISTYGFRGEALASISHIAHLTVTTRTVDSSCAWRAKYEDGNLVPVKPGQSADPKPIAGRQGTQIHVEDLFYNMPQRRKAFKSPSEEYAKILDVVGRYAIHCSGVAFSCKKQNETSMSIAVTRDSSTKDRVRQIYGSSVANELMAFQASDESYGFEANGLMSNANYNAKKSTTLLFVNHRSVESGAVKSAVQRTYAPWLPKGGHPFVYLSLVLEPERVDVNVHPTKREVNFLNEDEIIEIVCESIRSELCKVDTSRTFLTQSLLPSGKAPDLAADQVSATKPTGSTRPAENNLVRTDPSLRKITSMLTSVNTESQASALEYKTIEKQHMQIRLTSIKDLRATVRELTHGGLSELFAAHTFVGIVDTARRIAAVQSGVNLYLVDYGLVCHEYFYQIGLTDFGNFGTIMFDNPLDIKVLVALAAEAEQNAAAGPLDLSDAPRLISELLIEKREMLKEYFSFQVTEDGLLAGIPILVKGYIPPLCKLPELLLRLGPCVTWDDEKECFHTLLDELASFHVPEQLPNEEAEAADETCTNNADEVSVETSDIRARKTHVCESLEYILFPAFRSRLVATKGLLGGVIEVANLKGLYRVFERC